MWKEISCPTCDGWGEYWDNYFGAFYPCDKCGGPGWVYDVPVEDDNIGLGIEAFNADEFSNHVCGLEDDSLGNGGGGTDLLAVGVRDQSEPDDSERTE